MFTRKLGAIVFKVIQRAPHPWLSGAVCEAGGQTCSWRTYASKSRCFGAVSSYGEYAGFSQNYPLDFVPRRRPDYPRAMATAVVLVGGGAIFWYSCWQEIPYTHRVHTVFTTDKFDRSIGESQFRQLKEAAQRAGVLLPECHPLTELVKKLGTRLVEKATGVMCCADGYGGGFQDHLKDLDWEFAVVHSNSGRAGVLPGGKVVVFTGLLKSVDNQDELAAVMAHEIAHVVARHHAEPSSGRGVSRLLPALTEMYIGLPHSRRQEKEADIIGMDLAARACFEPCAAMAVFRKLGAAEKQFMDKERVQYLQEHLPEARRLAEQESCDVRRPGGADVLRQVWATKLGTRPSVVAPEVGGTHEAAYEVAPKL